MGEINPAYENIMDTLKRLDIEFESLRHNAVQTCSDSLTHRTNAGWTGASSKCIVYHAKGRFYLVVTVAEKDIKARLFKKQFGTKNIRFASPEEVHRETGCETGSVPPFGHDNPGLPYYVDLDIFKQDHFMFNPADPKQSIRINSGDLLRIYEDAPNPVKFFEPGEDKKLMFHDKHPFENA